MPSVTMIDFAEKAWNTAEEPLITEGEWNQQITLKLS